MFCLCCKIKFSETACSCKFRALRAAIVCYKRFHMKNGRSSNAILHSEHQDCRCYHLHKQLWPCPWEPWKAQHLCESLGECQSWNGRRWHVLSPEMTGGRGTSENFIDEHSMEPFLTYAGPTAPALLHSMRASPLSPQHWEENRRIGTIRTIFFCSTWSKEVSHLRLSMAKCSQKGRTFGDHLCHDVVRCNPPHKVVRQRSI